MPMAVWQTTYLFNVDLIWRRTVMLGGFDDRWKGIASCRRTMEPRINRGIASWPLRSWKHVG